MSGKLTGSLSRHLDSDHIGARREFANTLRRVREQAGLTVRDPALATGVPYSTLAGYASGRHLPPVRQPWVPAGTRAGRHPAAVEAGAVAVDVALARMAQAVRTQQNLISTRLDAARGEATPGAICGAPKAEWYSYREPARF